MNFIVLMSLLSCISMFCQSWNSIKITKWHCCSLVVTWGLFHKTGFVKTLGLLTLKWEKKSEFSISQREVTQTRETGITLACFRKRGNLSSRSVSNRLYEPNLDQFFLNEPWVFLSPPSFRATNAIWFPHSFNQQVRFGVVLPSVIKKKSVGLY